MEKHDSYLKFIDEALEVAKSIPRYFSKFSKKLYCNHQKFAIYVLMQKLKMTTRGVVSFVRNNPDVKLYLGLHRVPNHSTIVRFVKKIKKLTYAMLGIKQASIVAVDATGFELESKSYYYRNIDKRLFKNYIKRTKHYMKLSIAIDTNTQLILAHKMRYGPRNDNIDFKELLRELKVDCVVADKGYSSKANRRFVLNNLHAMPIIPYKKTESIYKLCGGRKILNFDENIYHQRSKIETVFSVLKRKYGSCLRCRSYATQKVELTCRLIAYNIDRKINYLLFFIRGLHQS
jgi:hypothetical protein